jgi:hypothetical protein
MSTAGSDVVPLSQKHPSAASVAGFVVLSVAFFLCALLLFGYIGKRMQDRRLATQRRRPPPVPEKDRYIRTMPVPSPRTATEHKTTTLGHLVPARSSPDCATYTIFRGVEALATIPSVGSGSSMDCERATSPRCSLDDVEGALPEPLPRAWTGRDRLPERRLWCGSSGRSSWYSRTTSSWSFIGAEQLGEDIGRGLGAGPGPVTGSVQAAAYGHAALRSPPPRESWYVV